MRGGRRWSDEDSLEGTVQYTTSTGTCCEASGQCSGRARQVSDGQSVSHRYQGRGEYRSIKVTQKDVDGDVDVKSLKGR